LFHYDIQSYANNYGQLINGGCIAAIVSCMLVTLWMLVYEYIILGDQGKTRDIFVDLPTA